MASAAAKILKEVTEVRSRQSEYPVQGIFMRHVFSCSLIGGDKGVTEGRAMCLKVLSAMSATLLLSLVCINGASAEGGCGPGFHRGPYGGCQPNRGPVVVVPAAPVVVAPGVVAPPVVCGVGYRWHPGFRHCVVL